MSKNIPIYNLYKKLSSNSWFEFSKLEESYNTYDATSPHRHNYFELLYFIEEGGEHEIDFISYPIKKNVLHFVSPEQVHQLRRNKNVTGYVFSFTREFYLDDQTNLGFIDSIPFFDIANRQQIINIEDSIYQKEILDSILKIQKEYLSENIDKFELIQNYLSNILIISKRLFRETSIENKLSLHKSEITKNFKKLVEHHFKDNKSVSSYALLLNITPGHLNDTIQKDTGKSASEIIFERLILESKRLLYHSPLSVKEIAFELNYDDPSHFTRFFKNQTNATPEQFRKEIREKYH